ncbi:MAG: SGNH/GDSL hydrolase family protein, partial [Elusimicrobiota bacterium]
PGNGAPGTRKFSMDEGRLLWLGGAAPLFESAGPAGSGSGDRMAVAPEFADSTRRPEFDARKEAGVYRVFCIGGSTTAGWPFHTASYPRLLSLLLGDVLPGRKVEVINAGFEASDSASDVRLVEQVLTFEPDLLLVYEGRNERWNLPLHRGWRGLAVKLHCRLLLSSRVYRGLARFASRRAGVEDFDRAARSWTETSGQASQAQVRASLSGNLALMAGAARRRGCPLMILTQAASPEEIRGNPEIFSVNSWLRDFASAQGLPLADVEKEFRDRWPRADRLVIPTPTVHPDLAGYVLIARVVARALAKNGLIAPGREWRWGRARGDAEYAGALGMQSAELKEVYSSLGRFFEEQGLPRIARRYFERADRPLALSRSAR